jgi:hypothetical protein
MAAKPSETWKEESHDLHTQLEELLDSVWQAEADWRLHDRIDLSLDVDRKQP